MSKTVKVIVYLIIAVLLLGAGYAAYVYFKPVKVIADQKADVQLSDKELLKYFTENQQAANIKYENKILELSGTVKKTEVNDSVCTVIFDEGGDFIIIANCALDAQKDVQQLKQGAQITIKGIYSGYIINDETFMIPAEIKIDKCTLTK
ncbi:MAG: hypothetical protein IT271_08485 [Chitinophagales bacterium]|nr:hypothetical protein [Chitinophagales bacterium]